MKDYSLVEAAALLGTTEAALRKRINLGTLAAVSSRKGSRHVWRVTEATIRKLQDDRRVPADYDSLVGVWVQEQESGYHNNRPMTPRSIEANLYGLGKFWQHLGTDPDISLITADNLRRALTNGLIDHGAKNCHFTIRDQMYKAVCSLMKFLVRHGLRDRVQLMDFYGPQIKPKRVYYPKHTVVTEEQFQKVLTLNEALLSGRDSGFDRELSRILLFVTGYAGLRRAELVGLRLDDVDYKEKVIHVVDGKGHKNRLVGIVPELVLPIRRWLLQRAKLAKSDSFFVMDNGQGITSRVIEGRLRRLGKKANIHLTAHTLRRFCGTRLSDKGVPVAHIAMLMGHASIVTTERSYIKTDVRDALGSMQTLGA